MPECCNCGTVLPKRKSNSGRCLPCGRIYNKEWRQRRNAEGRPIVNKGVWDPAKKSAWIIAYYSRPDVKARKAAQMKESQGRHPERAKARRMVRHEISMGRMSRGPCEQCGNPKTHGHHDDYTKPLAVRWLCRSCHDAYHAKIKERP